VRLEHLELEAAGEEAALEEGGVPVLVVPERRVDADPEGEDAVAGVPGGIDVGRELDDVAGLEAAARALVAVGRVLEVEPGLELEALQLGDRRRVVEDRRRVGGAGGKRPGLADGAGAVLEEPEAGGGGAPRLRGARGRPARTTLETG